MGHIRHTSSCIYLSLIVYGTSGCPAEPLGSRTNNVKQLTAPEVTSSRSDVPRTRNLSPASASPLVRAHECRGPSSNHIRCIKQSGRDYVSVAQELGVRTTASALDLAAAQAARHRSLLTWRSFILEDLAHRAVLAITREVCAAYRHAEAFWAPVWRVRIS